MRTIDADVIKQTVKDMIMPYEVRQEVLKAIDETPHGRAEVRTLLYEMVFHSQPERVRRPFDV